MAGTACTRNIPPASSCAAVRCSKRKPVPSSLVLQTPQIRCSYMPPQAAHLALRTHSCASAMFRWQPCPLRYIFARRIMELGSASRASCNPTQTHNKPPCQATCKDMCCLPVCNKAQQMAGDWPWLAAGTRLFTSVYTDDSLYPECSCHQL